MGRGIIIHDGIGPVVDALVVGTAIKVTAEMQAGAMELEQYAKYTAPWTDQTGNARDGLTADVFQEGGEIVIDLRHSVDYGIWLELIQDGAFAVIMPTLEALGPDILARSGAMVVSTTVGFLP